MVEVTQKNMQRRIHNTMYNPLPMTKQKAIDDREKRLEEIVIKLWEQQNQKRNDRQEPVNHGW
jgi:hypothetical protein